MEPLTVKTAGSTPASSPGLFSPMNAPNAHRPLPSVSDGTPLNSPYLHPLQMHKVRETHKAQVEQDFITGRKLINQYEIIDEIGRGVHGKVKLARNLETGNYVAIKIIQRFSKKRRLGRVTVSPEDKTKREIAILKKIRHPNVVGLLEVIDDPELKKIYMVLEHVELGEIVWRKKGVQRICRFERRRVEKEQRGEDTTEDEALFRLEDRRWKVKEMKRANNAQRQPIHGRGDYWSLEHGDDIDTEGLPLSRHTTRSSLQNMQNHNIVPSARLISHSNPGSQSQSRATSRAPSRAPSRTSSRAHTPLPEHDIPAIDSDNEGDEPGPLLSSGHPSASALEGTYYGSYPDEPPYRGRSPSMADSIISHMSSVDDVFPHDPHEEDYSFVPCFTLEQARSAFRDTVLGLEYLHYEGIVHRDIKPANLLWTKDHRIKISDFGVSYFGRPIRPGEPEENVSEADAADFDDDLELAKTVGTPAFFAPELCYTDIEVEQPKVTEQIDVWSLGITLYCLIFARLPFLADDEYQLFKCIAKDNVYIPRRRLKAVDCSTVPHTRQGSAIGPYREEGELAFEDIDMDLHDLLRRMLIKDPTERIKLREVKRHPWVLAGIDNILGWIDDTDPSRKTAGRRIQVDRTELDHAVVPITFLERARSALKKTVNKVIGRTDRADSGSRRRAMSSATSSGTDIVHTPVTPAIRDSRRSSLRGDESSYFASVSDLQEQREPYEHPLAQSLTASPDISQNGEDPFSLDYQQSSVGATPKRRGSRTPSDIDVRPGPPDRTISNAASIQTVVHRGHNYSKSISVTTSAKVSEEGPRTPGPFTDHYGNVIRGNMWTGRDFMNELEEARSSGAKSVDRGVFTSENKHSGASVAMSKAVAPGHFEHATPLHHPQPTRSAELSPTNDEHNRPLPSPLFFQPYMVQQHQMVQSNSTPNVSHTAFAASNIDDRPATANRTPEGKTPAPRVYGISTTESFARAQQELERKKKLEATEKAEAEQKRKELAASSQVEIQPLAPTECPPSPDDEIFQRKQEESQRAQSSSSFNSNSIVSQVTSPSDLTSPISSVNLSGQEQTFPSEPSLPALVSSGSSICADAEGDFLQRPGSPAPAHTVFTSDSTPETLTPPLLSKQDSLDEGTTPTGILDVDEEGYNGDGDTTLTVEEEDDDSDSDEGLTMTRRKPASKVGVAMARRDTNASVGSTDTAKKVALDGV